MELDGGDWVSLSLATVLVWVIPHVAISAGEDTLAIGEVIRTNQTLTSSDGTFALGFFDSGNSTHHLFHLAVWYARIPGQTVVWLANRNSSLTDPDGGGATIAADGNLVVFDGKSTVVWSSGLDAPGRTSAVVEESGNLALEDGEGRIVWQSFDFPSDTLLPGMSLRLNLTTGTVRGLVSWSGPRNPSPGQDYFGPDPAWPVQFIVSTATVRRWRSAWITDGVLGFRVSSGMSLNALAMYLTVTSTRGREMIWTVSTSNASMVWKMQLNSSGILEMRTWLPEAGVWRPVWNLASNVYSSGVTCRLYARCGPNGVCNRNKSPECTCLPGFYPKRATEWGNGNWTAGCERQISGGGVACGEGDGFFKMGPIKLPDFPVSLPILGAQGCADQCLLNCSCSAYTYANVSFEPSPRCLHWTGVLMDLEDNYTTTGQDLFIRLSKRELDRLNTAPKKSNNHLVLILISTIGGGLIMSSALVYLLWRRLKSRGKELNSTGFRTSLNGEDLPFINFVNLQAATENFSAANKLGEGGFGPVYKGKLPSGQEIAVKRLSHLSGQGLVEFNAEVELIAKLQHRNLVRLLGWCIHKDEKLLIYEFMPNISLDRVLFEPTSNVKLDWGRRIHIAEGIAQGLLYLHKHSRLTIIHRDLKTSNILLDGEMNAKISDFGLARIVGGSESRANTKKVVGTYGYMSPEYAIHGVFSEKSDVYSFGVILLELVSGKRGTGVYPLEHSENLSGYIWKLWMENRCLELIDASISMTEEVARCVHIALLCVQKAAADRPSMPSVVLMLSNKNQKLPFPKEPAFYMIRSVVPSDPSPYVFDSMSSGTGHSECESIVSSAYYSGR